MYVLTPTDHGRSRCHHRTEAAPVHEAPSSSHRSSTPTTADAALDPVGSPGDRLPHGGHHQRGHRINPGLKGPRVLSPSAQRVPGPGQAGHRSRGHSGLDGPPQPDVQQAAAAAADESSAERRRRRRIRLEPVLQDQLQFSAKVKPMLVTGCKVTLPILK